MISRLHVITSCVGLVAWAALVSSAPGQTSALTIQKNGVGFGASVGDLGDLDGDGVHDILVGSPLDSTVVSTGGAVHVYSGATGAPLYSVFGPGNGEFSFGLNVVVLGDCDLDGKADFEVHQAPSASPSSFGRIRVYSGASGALLHDLVGTSYGMPQFGRAVDACGDFDGDGRADMLVSAMPVWPCGGVVCVISGADGSLLQSVTGAPCDSLGEFVAGLGDVDADGVPDFAASANQSSGVTRATVYSGASGAFIRSFTFSNNNGFLRPLVGHADFNGDGRRDLLVPQSGNAIRVFDALSGNVLATVLAPVCDTPDPLCPQCRPFAAIADAVGDRDGDNRPDIAEYDGRFARWRIISSATGATLLTITDKAAGNGDIRPIASTPDRDGDGKADLIVGFPNGSFGSPTSSRIMLITAEAGPQGVPIALGDGTGSACPCNNPGQAGAGCANSTGVGARLGARGTTSIQFDNLLFETQGIPVGAAALLFLGTGMQASGLGVPFRDGLLGAGGALTRVRVRIAACAAGADIGPALGSTAYWSSGQTYVAQVWYRDNGGPCGTGSNLTNGLHVTLTP